MDREEAAAIIAAGGASTAPGDRKIVHGCAEICAAVPHTTFSVNGIEIVKFRNQRSRDETGALLGGYRPPARAGRDFAVETADCHAHGLLV